MSKLRYHALLEQIHCSQARGFTAEQLPLLCDPSFIEKSENILTSELCIYATYSKRK